MTSHSVLVPVLNEQYLMTTSIERLRVLESRPYLALIKVVVDDDCSRASTPAVLKAFKEKHGIPAVTGAEPPPLTEVSFTGRGTVGRTEWVFLRHDVKAARGT